MLDLAGPWTFEQLADLPDDGRRYEVVDGHLVVTPPPSQRHQLVALAIQGQLQRQCPAEWLVAIEFPLPLGTDGRVPDIAVVRAGTPDSPGRYPRGADWFGLVVEITSPGSRKTDLFAKPGEYAEAGIGLMRRIDLEPEVVLLAFAIQDGRYVTTAVVRDVGTAPAPWGEVALDLRSLPSA